MTHPRYYHSAAVLNRTVSALDGSTYARSSDGRFSANGSGWVGLTAAGGARTAAGISPCRWGPRINLTRAERCGAVRVTVPGDREVALPAGHDQSVPAGR